MFLINGPRHNYGSLDLVIIMRRLLWGYPELFDCFEKECYRAISRFRDGEKRRREEELQLEKRQKEIRERARREENMRMNAELERERQHPSVGTQVDEEEIARSITHFSRATQVGNEGPSPIVDGIRDNYKQDPRLSQPKRLNPRGSNHICRSVIEKTRQRTIESDPPLFTTRNLEMANRGYACTFQ